MTTKNTYATLAEYKAYFTARGSSTSTDTADDAVIVQLLETGSRYLDSKCSRSFAPFIKTMYYSIPDDYGRAIWLEDDLQEVITFLNGDTTSIASSEYYLLPRNYTPKHELVMKLLSSVTWEFDSNGESEFVLALTGITGYHNDYARAWKSVGTLGAAISDTTGLSFTFTSGHTLLADNIFKIDNEIFICATAGATTVTVPLRGDNGSTAATHTNGSTVYVWQPMADARNAVCEIANTAYRRRFGESMGNTSTLTAGGIMLVPRDIPDLAKDFIMTYQRRVI